MGVAQLGNYTFRIDPSQVFFAYEVDTQVVNTVGGRVVQVYGVTLGDITVQGLFGQEHIPGGRDSWEMAEEFQQAVALMVQQQSQAPTNLQMQGRDPTPMHQPFRFFYNNDTPDTRAAGLPVHNWDLMVYIKDLQDVNAGGFTVEHATGKYSYGYTLTLFIVQDNSAQLREVAMNNFISRLSDGIGWKRSLYNGPMDKEEIAEYVKANSPDGTIHGLILKKYSDAAGGSYYDGVPGGVITQQAAAAAAAQSNTTGVPPATPPTGVVP